ncbi:MAG: 2'-deoxycytidine 5'-triphosphate deaminase [Planctomycetes bacterium]|nr:2'-deoxycytidine 5'-triphosphate deaminase [Planctomycetota bacterium]
MPEPTTDRSTTRSGAPSGPQAGILVDREIRALISAGKLRAERPIEDDQLQPASIDLRLGHRVHRVRCGFLADDGPVTKKLEELTLYAFDIQNGGVLECGMIYLIPLLESLELPAGLAARANPKSTTGRLDLFTRLVTDRNPRFDDVPAGYTGRLYLEVSPRTFPIKVHAGDRLSQLRFAAGDSALDGAEVRALYARHPLAYDAQGAPLAPGDLVFDADGSITFRIGLRAPLDRDGRPRPVGYRAKAFGGVVDLAARRTIDPAPFFDPVYAPDGRVVIEPEKFYIFASRERVLVPPDHAAEMVAYDVGIGELRTNYAGFFDNGFGAHTPDPANGLLAGTPAILEVRAHDVPFLIEDGQPVFRLRYFRTTSRPDVLYGQCGSSYARQTLDLAKQFRRG